MHLLSPILRVRSKTEKFLEEYNKPSLTFFVLMILASAIVSFGLVMNNAAIIIGGMVVAPLITPVFGLSLSFLLLRIKKIGLTLLSICLGTIFALVTSIGAGYLVTFLQGSPFSLNFEIMSRAVPTLLFFIVAFLSGMAGAFAYTKPKIISSITGIAISVAMVPPIAVSGLMISIKQWQLAQQSFALYIFNLAGIIFGSIIMFLLLGFGKNIHK